MEIVKIERYLRNVNKYVYSTLIFATAIVFLIFGMLLAYLHVYLRELNLEQTNSLLTSEVSVTGTDITEKANDSFYFLVKNKLYEENFNGTSYTKTFRTTVKEGYTLDSYLGGNLWSYLGPGSGNLQERGLYNAEKDEYKPVNIKLTGATLLDTVYVNADRYVYTAAKDSLSGDPENISRVNIFLHDQGTDYQLLDNDLQVAKGTGYSASVVKRLILSPDKSKILFLDSDSAEKTFIVFDLITRQQLANISGVYTADWQSNSSIIYQDQNKEIRDFNLVTRQDSLLKAMADFLVGFHYYREKIIFWKYDQQKFSSFVYVYNLTTGQTKKLLDDATMPMWLTDGKLVAVSLVKTQLDSPGKHELLVKGLAVIDINNNTVTELPDTVVDYLVQDIFTNVNSKSYHESLLSIN